MAGRTMIGITTVSRMLLTAFPQPTVAADVTNGNVTPNDGATFLAIFNADSVVRNVTVQLARGVDSLTAGPRPYAVPSSTSGTQVVGPFPIHFYGTQLLWNADNANIKVTAYSLLGP